MEQVMGWNRKCLSLDLVTYEDLIVQVFSPLFLLSQVKRVDYKVDNMEGYAQWSLTRSCETECRPFCVTMGGRTKVTYCTSCCRWDGSTWDPRTKTLKPGPRSDNCNVGNAANARKVVFTSWLATTLPMMFAILASHF